MHPYVLALIGGALIGLSSALLMALSGRIAGISGIVGALLPPKAADDRSWRIAFLLGLIAAPLLLGLFTGDRHIGPPTVGMPVLVAAGLLVGIGTTLGGGCTSGHGICGIARISPRSLVATVVFVLAGIVTVFVTRHVL